MTTFPENLFRINMLTLGELNILEKSRSVHSLHACVIMVALKIYHIEHFTLQSTNHHFWSPN